MSGRIDLGARLGPALTACIGVTTRGVRAYTRYARGARPATTPGADVRALRYHIDRVRGAQSLRYPDPEPLDDVHKRRVDDVLFGPGQGSDLLMIGEVSRAVCPPALTPVRPDFLTRCPARPAKGHLSFLTTTRRISNERLNARKSEHSMGSGRDVPHPSGVRGDPGSN